MEIPLALHLIAAAVWAGGLVFLGIAAGVARHVVPARERIEFFRLLGRRFLLLAALAAALLAATGADLATDRLGSWSDLTGTSDGRLMLAKTILFAVVIVAAAVHGLVLGPRTRRARQSLLEGGDAADSEAEIRRTSALSGALSGLMLLLTVVIFFLAAGLGS